MADLGLSGTIVVLFDIHKLKLNCYTRDAVNKPVWRDLTCVARTSCLLAKYMS